MNGEQHLASLPAYVINLDWSTRRWHLAQSSIKPFVASMTRVSGVDGATLTIEEVREFQRAATSNPNLSIRGEKGISFWRGAMGLWLAQQMAILEGMLHDRYPFLVLEDDARFYRQDLARATVAPATDGIYIWGGALKGSSHTGPARRYAEWDGRQNTWSKIVGDPKGRHGTTAIEFRTEKDAGLYLRTIAANPHAVDISWWQCMRLMDCYIADLEVIQQCPVLRPDRSSAGGRTKAAQLLLDSII